MKLPFPILLLLFLVTATAARSQSVIFSCQETGSYGIGIVAGGATLQQCKVQALKDCNKNGGTACRIWYTGKVAGWFAFISGKNRAGELIFEKSEGNKTKAEAEADVREKYKAKGGIYPDLTRVTSWYLDAGSK